MKSMSSGTTGSRAARAKSGRCAIEDVLGWCRRTPSESSDQADVLSCPSGTVDWASRHHLGEQNSIWRPTTACG